MPREVAGMANRTHHNCHVAGHLCHFAGHFSHFGGHLRRFVGKRVSA